MPKDVGESGVRTRSAESLRAQYIIRFSAFLCTESHIYSMLGVHLLYTPTVTACLPLSLVSPFVTNRRAVSSRGFAPGLNYHTHIARPSAYVILRQGRALPLRRVIYTQDQMHHIPSDTAPISGKQKTRCGEPPQRVVMHVSDHADFGLFFGEKHHAVLSHEHILLETDIAG